ncbi:MAG: hypothetical protein WCK03_04640 [Candidatus Taylorbacteria bacterium]
MSFAIKEHIIPLLISKEQENFIYADEAERLIKLNEIAITQMKALINIPSIKKLEGQTLVAK